MRLPRDNPSATLLGDGDILIVGGNAAAKEDHYTVGLVLPDKRYVDADVTAAGEAGVPAWLGSGRLAQLSPEDRHTAAIHYLYRKPERC